VAAQWVSKGILEAARVENGRATGRDFAMLAGLPDLTPDVNPGRGGLGAHVMQRFISTAAAKPISNWPLRPAPTDPASTFYLPG
jgi:hypothetical protein